MLHPWKPRDGFRWLVAAALSQDTNTQSEKYMYTTRKVDQRITAQLRSTEINRAWRRKICYPGKGLRKDVMEVEASNVRVNKGNRRKGRGCYSVVYIERPAIMDLSSLKFTVLPI